MSGKKTVKVATLESPNACAVRAVFKMPLHLLSRRATCVRQINAPKRL